MASKATIRFTGNGWEFFGKYLGLMLVTLATFGLAVPWFIYWQFRYLYTNLEIDIENHA